MQSPTVRGVAATLLSSYQYCFSSYGSVSPWLLYKDHKPVSVCHGYSYCSTNGVLQKQMETWVGTHIRRREEIPNRRQQESWLKA